MKSDQKILLLNDKKIQTKALDRLSILDLEPPVHWEIAKNMFSLYPFYYILKERLSPYLNQGLLSTYVHRYLFV